MESDLLEQLGFNRENRNSVSKALSGSLSKEEKDKQDIRPLVDLIVRQAVSDKKYGSNAAKLCSIFVENEAKSTKESRFRNVLLTKLQREYTTLRTSTQQSGNENQWVAFVTFLSSIFHHIRIGGEPLKALVTPVLECLSNLSNIANESRIKDEIIQCIVMQLQFHGKELEKLNEQKMAELFNVIRELFLSDDTSQLSRLMLLEIIELRASSWQLSAPANQYYYGGVNGQN